MSLRGSQSLSDWVPTRLRVKMLRLDHPSLATVSLKLEFFLFWGHSVGFLLLSPPSEPSSSLCDRPQNDLPSRMGPGATSQFLKSSAGTCLSLCDQSWSLPP